MKNLHENIGSFSLASAAFEAVCQAKKFLLAFALFVGFQSAVLSEQISQLEKNFSSPPNSAKPYTWWHWMNMNVTKSGIVKDLHAMKELGLGGFHLFNVAPQNTAKGSLKWGSVEWKECLNLVSETANKLGLEFVYHNCAGFATTAGAAVTPEHAMKQLVWTRVRTSGKDKITLPRFTVENNNGEVPLVFTINDSQPEQHPKKNLWQNEYYKDVAVIAFPTPADELGKDAKPFRLDMWTVKAGYGKQVRYYSEVFPKPDMREAPSPINPEEIVDLSDKMAPDGSLNWTPPDSREWTIMRFGHTITGMQNHPAPEGARGLECDKFSKSAMDFYFENCVKPIIDFSGEGLKGLLVDSYEAREQNWTPLMPQEFKAAHGYDIKKYLPAFSGRVIGSTEQTERFLFDVRRTFADLMSRNHYGRFGELCRENGLIFITEPYGGPSSMDSIQAGLKADMLMGEYWAGRTAGRSDMSIKLAASISAYLDCQIVGAESFTSGRGPKSYEDHPATFKKQGDFFFTQGMNRMVFHAFAHQPFADSMKPGMSMWIWGSQMHRNVTWFPEGKDWVRYITRAQYILQNGKLQTDAAMYYGRNTPATLNTDFSMLDTNTRFGTFKAVDINADCFPPMPSGHDYHVVNDDILFGFSVSENGDIIHKGSGNSYKVLVLKDQKDMDLDVLKKVASLVKDGACVVMSRPERASTFADSKNVDSAVRKLASEMFSNEVDGYFSYGKGKIFTHAYGLGKVFDTLDIVADFEFISNTNKPETYVKYIHRRLPDADIYFVANLSDFPVSGDFLFREAVSGIALEVWNAENGLIYPCPRFVQAKDGRTKINTTLGADTSRFFVFRRDKAPQVNPLKNIAKVSGRADVFISGGDFFAKSYSNGTVDMLRADGSGAKANFSGIKEEICLDEDWTLSFPQEEGVRQNIKLDKLASWTKFEAFDEKHFSGTATYFKTFDLPEGYLKDGFGVELDLGDVRIIAHAYLNGHDLGTLWKKPFKTDITKYLKPGRNILVVRLTNTFTNRLAGDALLPDDCPQRNKSFPAWAFDESIKRPKTGRKTFFSYEYITKKDAGKLVDSGLLGGVKLVPYEIVQIE